MSFQAMTWATAQDLPCKQKMVLLMLANRTNQDTGRCDPSHKRLAADCGMSVASVKRALSALAEGGFLTVIHRSEDGVNLPNHYQLNLEGVGSQRTEGWGQDEPRVGSQRATKQEFNQEVKTLEERAPEKREKTKSKTPVPEDFSPNDNNRRLAAEMGVSVIDEVAQFCDYHAAKGSLMKDWHRAFNTWLRNARKFNGGTPQNQRSRQELTLD